ncbi:hypothetical protein HG530_006798 [Fusarium avenaceum]|nr:hypothetical protein HG530_006798 [Fusarium avenaceum]
MTDFESLPWREFDHIIVKNILEEISQRAARGKIAAGKVLADPKVFSAQVEHAVALFSIAAGAAYLLAVFLDSTWDVPMDDVADICRR